MLSAPPHIAGQIQDRGAARNQIRRIDRELENQTPKAYEGPEKDAAIRRSEELESQFTTGMPTQAEMRRNPAGAVDKHRKWEARNKRGILEYKNIALRLHAGDDSPDKLADASDIANIERLRPVGGSQELNMDNEQIPGRVQIGPVPGAGPAVVFSEEETALLEKKDPVLHSQIGLMNNDQRVIVKHMVTGMMEDTRNRKATGERLKKAREAKKGAA